MSYELSELRKLRKRIGLTQKQLADKAGVSQSMIAKIESGRLDPGYTKTKQIFDALDELVEHDGLKARDIMQRKIVSITPKTTVAEAIKLMKKHGISQMPVVRAERVVGKVSERLLLEKMASGDIRGHSIATIMDSEPPTINQDTRSDVVVTLLKHFSLLVVVQDGVPVGVITKSDVLEKLYG